MLETKYKFYSCRYDKTFKEIFLDKKNEDILKVLLEEILGLKIKNIELLPTEFNSGNINVARKTVDALLDTDKGKIEIEVNSCLNSYVHPRNLAYLCNIYSRHTLVGKEYTEDTDIIQLNLTYGIKDEEIIRKYKLVDEYDKEFVKNFKIYEINMDKIMSFWYDKDEKKIQEFKHLIMLGLNKEELVKMDSNDKVVKKYMDKITIVNNDPMFQEYMSKEEDQEKIFNSRLKEAKEEGLKWGINQEKIAIAKSMLDKNMNLNDISDITNLSKEELQKLL